MVKKYFIPSSDDGKTRWLQNFSSKLANYKSKYGISQADIDDMVNGVVFLSFWLNYRNEMQNFVKKLTAYKNEIISGEMTSSTASAAPVAPVLGTVPTAVTPGLFRRAAALAAAIKGKLNYTVADGEDLGIEGADAGLPDLSNAKPQISFKFVNGGYPEILWHKGDFDGIVIYADKGAGYTQIGTDNHPNFVDKSPLPAAGKSEVRKYQVIYWLHDEEVGEFSDPLTVTVTGSI